MRWSRFYLYTTREVPNDAEVVSHRLMLRAGMIKKLAAGIYTYSPLGWRVIRKLMDIVREEMNRAGAVELSMPAIQPAELWRESGRWSVYGKELLRMQDRHERDFCFGPTHEEVITDFVRHDVKSYRQLPLNLYQMQTKFRDEIRPRFGLMRGREFLMKDAYSFHTGEDSLRQSYGDMTGAYRKIFEACQLDYSVVEADSGAIGGSSSHEFMVLADTGESAIVSCAECGYAANVEKAEAPAAEAGRSAPSGDGKRLVPTPGASSVEEVAALLEVEPDGIVKTLIFDSDLGLVAVAVRGDRSVNDIKVKNAIGATHLGMAGEDKVRQATGAGVGYAGPVGLGDGVRLLADHTTAGLVDFVCGANQDDAHLVGVNWGVDAEPELVDVLQVEHGDPCPSCGQPLRASRGIEVGHTFMLGSKYSEAMQCTFTDENGEVSPMIMGCYGLGISRTVAAAIEQNHDDDGIRWPVPLAPFEVLLIALNPNNDAVREASEALYRELEQRKLEVLYDDRDERPGVKFNDADLIGIPIRIVVGQRNLQEGKIEMSLRSQRQKRLVAVEDGAAAAEELLLQLSVDPTAGRS